MKTGQGKVSQSGQQLDRVVMSSYERFLHSQHMHIR